MSELNLVCGLCGRNDFTGNKSLSNHKRTHNPKFKLNTRRQSNPNWKGGRFTRKDGYVYILGDNGKYEAEHRLIAQKMLGRILEKSEVVHHINGIKNDNRPENLQIITQSEHCKIEGFNKGSKGKKWSIEHKINFIKSRWEDGKWKKS